MNKKLLLSFAVFATALSVNAQKRGGKLSSENLKSPRNLSVVADDYSLRPVTNIENNTFNTPTTSKKRSIKNDVDTSWFFDLKQRYTTAAPSGVTILPYMNATNDSVEVTVYSQTIHNLSKAKYKLNGMMLIVGSRNKAKGSSNVNVRIYDDQGKIVAGASKNIPYTTATGLSLNSFVFDNPVTTSGDLTFYVEGESAYDTIRVYSSGAYRNLSISANITGDKLKLVSPAPQTNIGTGFWTGQEISGNGILPGTFIKSYNSATKEYTLTQPATDGSNVVVAGKSLTFDDYKFSAIAEYYKFPKLQNGEPDKTKQPAYDMSAIHGISGVGPTDGHLYFYPLIEYSYDNTFIASNQCLGNKAEVEVNESAENPFYPIAKNPLLNKMAFYALINGKGYYHGAVFTTSKSFSDTLFQSRAELKSVYTAKNVDANDSIIVGSLFWKYGYNKPVSAPSQFFNVFRLSSKMSSTSASLVSPILCNGGDAKVNVTGTLGGYAPYTGEGEQTGVKAGERTFVVTDANGCSTDAKLTVAEPAVLSAVASAVDASNDKTNDGKASVVATGGTAPYTYEWSASAGATAEVTVGKGDYTVVVKDANSCSADAAVTVKAGTASIAALAISNLSVYPNPVKESLTVKFDSKSTATVELVNVAGQVIDSKVSSDVTFNTTSLVSGVYFVNIKVAEGVFTQKLIKE